MTLFEDVKAAFNEGLRQFELIMAENEEEYHISEVYNGAESEK